MDRARGKGCPATGGFAELCRQPNQCRRPFPARQFLIKSSDYRLFKSVSDEANVALLQRARNVLLERRGYWLVPITTMLVVAFVLFAISAGGRVVSAIYLMR